MRYIIILLTIFFSFYSKSQTFLTVKSVKYENNRISAYNAQNHVVYQVDCKDFVWQRNPDLTIKVWDDIHSFTLTSTITSPTWAAIEDSLRSWQTACSSLGAGSIDITGLDTSSQDTSLVVPSLIENTNTLLEAILLRNLDTTHTDTSLVQSEQLYQIIDSLGVINEKLNHLYKLDTSQQDTSSINYYTQLDSIITLLKDTIDFEYKSYCYRGKSDSGVYSFNVVFSALTPNTPTFINFTDVDSLYTLFEVDYRTGATIGVFPNIAQDYVPCEKWFEYLSANAVKDTIKALVYTTTAKVRTDRDTLFNCKSISFGRKSGASGTLVLTYENGESENFDVANDDLPAWVNGEFISYLKYDATSAVGLIVNTLGCSQTDTEICAKVKPIFDCELVVPITCNGWQSASGVWQTISGCWNTGQ